MSNTAEPLINLLRMFLAMGTVGTKNAQRDLRMDLVAIEIALSRADDNSNA